MRSLANTSAVMAALACAILSLSCTDSGDQNTVPDNVDTEASDIPETIPTELPVYEATENCPSEPPDPLTMCEWATAPDGIVFAKVVDTRGFENPAFVREEQRVTTTCSAANKGFELDLVVLETIVGSAPHSISVKLGSDSMDRWGDRPYLDDPNNPKWSQQADSRVLPGMIYGLALYDVGDSWTTAFDPFFARTPGDVLELPDGTQGLCEPMPHWLEGMTVQDLKNSMSLCSGTEGKERRNWVMTAADEAPHQVWAASCLD